LLLEPEEYLNFVPADAERALILERLEVQISEAKDLEFSRKDVLERMDKWQAALEEESWLEEYNRVRAIRPL
jgi:protein regulator of cytokinesis 1